MLRDDRALVPGSFDPVTRGHLDVIRRAARLFSSLHVGVVDNPEKESCFTPEQRIALLEAELADLEAVQVVSFRGLTVDLAVRIGARWIVRGIRNAADTAYELPMALTNRRCGEHEVETLFLATSSDVSFISSRLVRQIAASGGVLSPFVTPGVEKALRQKAQRLPGGGPSGAAEPRRVG
ncbi:MAG: pantetheine-phosphate adenylyltransferase [Planctomycetota bacterium]|nr:pantetheine-phosphate adenylyltransferase [Planctomycetota bacterium]